MAQNKIYEEIVYQIVTLLKQGQLYPRYIESIGEGKNDYKISQVYTKKNYSTEWIDTIEDCIVALDTIVRNPRKFIVVEEDIVDISLARSISVESVKHLSQHTNLIASVGKDGTVIPSKILNTSKEESFEIYENRFIYTLLLKIRDFIEIRSAAIKNALMQSGELGVTVESEFSVDRNKVRYSMSGNANFPFDPVVKKSGGGMTDMERVARIKMIISDFLASPFAKEMRSCALVRPPILRTNVILKDPNFKKALVLWQYIESNEKMDFKIETSTETVDMNPVIADKFRTIVYLNTILMQSIAATHETTESVEEKKEKDKIIADEYVTKSIDDFVPDDFPTLKLDINQIRTIYKKIPTEKTLSAAQISKINGAIDRVIRQYRINKSKEDSITRKRLIAEQLEAEKQAKKLALREKKDLERRLRAERARKRLEDRKLEEERKLEAERLAKEEEELRIKAEEARRKEEEQRKVLEALREEDRQLRARYEAEVAGILNEAQEAYDRAKADYEQAEKEFHEAIDNYKREQEHLEAQRRRKIELEAKLEIDRQTVEAEREHKKKIAAETTEATLKMRLDKVNTLIRMREETAKFWDDEKQKAIALAVKAKSDEFTLKEKRELEALIDKEKQNSEILAIIESVFRKVLDVSGTENLKQVVETLYHYGDKATLDATIAARITELKQMRKDIKRDMRDLKKKYAGKK